MKPRNFVAKNMTGRCTRHENKKRKSVLAPKHKQQFN